MKIGLAPPNYERWFDAPAAGEVCSEAETMGLGSLWFGDHVALPKARVDACGNVYLDALAVVGRLRKVANDAGKPCPRMVARWLIHPVEHGADRPAIPHEGELRRPRLDPSEAREQIDRIEALGVDEVIVDIPAKGSAYLPNMEFIHTHVMRREGRGTDAT